MVELPDTLELQVVVPHRLLVREEVDEVQIPARNGYLGVLPGHAPLLSELQMGELSYRRGNRWSHLSIFRGFVEVLAERVVVLAEVSERAEEIDLDRAREARRRAEERLQHAGDPDLDFRRAQLALQRALVRLQVAGKAGGAGGLAAGRAPEEPTHAP